MESKIKLTPVLNLDGWNFSTGRDTQLQSDLLKWDEREKEFKFEKDAIVATDDARIEVLEAQLKAKDEEIDALKGDIFDLNYIIAGDKAEIEGLKQDKKVMIDWLNNNFEPTVPMSLDYEKWHAKLKEWEME